MKCFAVLGAGGFIGYRLTEYLLLNEKAIPRPIVRSFRSMARVSKFRLDTRIADATDPIALAAALRGCDVAFHCVVGDRATILKSTEAVYAACRQAKVKRLVYLSTAVVHGLAPDPGIDEDTPLNPRQPFEYGVSKILAEQKLRSMMGDGVVQCVILRPCIVYGPRSTYWTAGLAADILAGRGYLVDEGRGICNAVYIDNLVDLMTLCATNPAAAGKTFLVKDKDRITWREFYLSIAKAVDVNETAIATVTVPARTAPTLQQVGQAVSRNRFVRAAKELARSRMTTSLATKLRKYFQSPMTDGEEAAAAVTLDPEIVAFQRCSVELPTRKVTEELGYKPAIGFAEATQRTGEWLRFALGGNQ